MMLGSLVPSSLRAKRSNPEANMRSASWIASSLALLAMTAERSARIELELFRRDGLAVGREACQQRLQGGQCRAIGDAVDARGAEVALERSDHFHGRRIVFPVDRDAV